MAAPPTLDPAFRPPSTEVMLSIPVERRGPILTQLALYDDEYGTHHIQDYRAAKTRCPHVDPDTGLQCTQQRWSDSYKTAAVHCLDHADVDELDPKWANEKKSRIAKARLGDMLTKAVDRLEELLDDDELAPALKLAAVTALFDRANVPKQTTQTVDAHVEVVDTTSAADVIRARLARLKDSYVDEQLQGIEAASSSARDPEIVDAEVVEPDDKS